MERFPSGQRGQTVNLLAKPSKVRILLSPRKPSRIEEAFLYCTGEMLMFYDKGLSFECQRCLYCCSAEPGYVFLTKSDIEAASSFLGLSEDQFIEIYCRYVDYGSYLMVSLKERDNFDCEFLSEKGCTIYPARPMQCRTYPFWKNIMESEKSWKKEGESCPGIGKGCRISRKEIEDRMKKSSEEPPYMIIKH